MRKGLKKKCWQGMRNNCLEQEWVRNTNNLDDWEVTGKKWIMKIEKIRDLMT